MFAETTQIKNVAHNEQHTLLKSMENIAASGPVEGVSSPSPSLSSPGVQPAEGAGNVAAEFETSPSRD